jgi:hypothetical protein
MKSILQLSLIILSLITMITSCKKEGCTDSKALNYDSKAKDDDGTCEYAFTRFLGTYNMNDTLSADGGPYYQSHTVVITGNSSSPDEIKILLESGVSLTAEISDNTFVIPNQPAGFSSYFGNGYLTDNTLRLVYTYLNGLNTMKGTGQRQ